MIEDPSYDQIWSGGWDDMRRYGPMARHTRRLMGVMTRDLTPRSILDVGCGEGSLLLRSLQPEGKRAMTAQEFLAGRKVAEEATEVLLAAKNDEAAQAAGIGRDQTQALLAGEAGDRLFEGFLDRAEAGLRLPTVKIGAVVGDE